MKNAIKNFFIACSVIICLSVSIYGQGTTQYVYDDNGRLKAVILPNGETSVYTYDAAGNIVSITRQNTPVVSISSFTSSQTDCQAAGNSEITVNGSGFISDPAQNTISFDEVPGTVISATPNQIIASLPSGFVAGNIKVTNANGTAVKFYGGLEFEDGSVGIAPNSNIARTFNIASSGQVISLCFEGTENKRISFLLNNTNFTELDIKLISPSETEIISSRYQIENGQIFIESSPFTETGRYFLKISSASEQTGSFNALLYEFEDVSATLTDDGVPSSVSITKPGQNARFQLSANGASYNLSFVNSTISNYTFYVVRNADHQIIRSASSLPAILNGLTSDYTLIFDPDGPVTGTAAVKLEPLTIQTDGTPETIQIFGFNETAGRSFAATAGQSFSLRVSDVTVRPSIVSIHAPDGQQLTSGFIDFFFTGTFLQFTAPIDGVYTVRFRSYFSSSTGSGVFSLNLLHDVVGTFNINDPPTTFTSTTAGQPFRISVAGNSGQRFFLKVTTNDFFSFNLVIRTPDDTELVSINNLDPSAAIDVINLTQTGIYTILLTPNFPGQSGNLTLQAIDHNVFLSNSPNERIYAYFRGNVVTDLKLEETKASRDKNPQKVKQPQKLLPPANLTGEPAVYFYNGTENETFSFSPNSQVQQSLNFIGGTISIYKEDGTLLESLPLDSGLCNLTLPETGRYRIEVAPDGGNQNFILNRFCSGPPSSFVPKANPIDKEIGWMRPQLFDDNR